MTPTPHTRAAHRAVRRLAAALLIAGVILTVGCNRPIVRQRGLDVWVVSGDRDVAPNAVPLPENEVYSAGRSAISLSAAINETIPVQLVARLAPDGGSRSYSIHVSDLRGPGEALPATSVIRLYHAHYVRVDQFRAWYTLHAGRHATPTLVADALVPWESPRGGGPLRPRAGLSEIIWMDVHVPPTTAPGEYAGRVELRATDDQSVVFQAALVLRVLPVALPSESPLPIVCRVDPRDLLAQHLNWPRESAEDTRLLTDAPSQAPALAIVDQAMTLLHEHRLNPVLWAAFPKFRPGADRGVDVVWEPYDDLVSRWVDGSAFPDRAGLTRWVYPLSLEYPDAQRNGGVGAAQYARILASYFAECRRHFAERGWDGRAIVRPAPPGELTQENADIVRRVAGILRQSDAPLLTHFPAQSPRGLGWYNAPAIDAPVLGTLAPRAMLFEPAPMRAAQAVGREAWFVPDEPPYSPSLRIEAPPTDARALAWQAYRYGVDGVWIEHAVDSYRTGAATGGASLTAAGEALLYPGMPFGVNDRPVPSIRLKRLRAGLQDFALLRLMERSGKQLLAQTIAQRVIRYAFTDACEDNLLTTQEAGWPTDPTVFSRAREMLLQELVNEFEPSDAGQARQLANLAGWGRVLQQASLLRTSAVGARLAAAGDEMRASVLLAATNRSDRAVSGRWSVPSPPMGARTPPPLAMNIPPGARRSDLLQMDLAGLAFNAEGIYEFAARFDTPALGAFDVPCRLAVAAAPVVSEAPTIDGDLSDWPRTISNSAGDFRLCRAVSGALENAAVPQRDADRPELPTQAHFCIVGSRLYIAVRCFLQPGAAPLWRGDNVVPVDGAIPWGQDVVEILLSPSDEPRGASGDIYCLQIKPSGLLISRKGCLTDPPIGPSEDWRSGAQVATHIGEDAWTVEVALPLASLGKPALQYRIWGLNVTRLDAARGEYSSWSGARGHCYSPATLGNLILQRP